MSFTVNELCSGIYTGTLVDETGAGFGGVTTLTLTLYNKSDQTIINNRNVQNILNLNQVTFNASTGLITWNMLPTDNPILNSGLKTETHVALFTAIWSAGAKQLNHEVTIIVTNLAMLP